MKSMIGTDPGYDTAIRRKMQIQTKQPRLPAGLFGSAMGSVYANGAPGVGVPGQPGGKGEGKEGNPPPGMALYRVTR